jgi:hypothetical protein
MEKLEQKVVDKFMSNYAFTSKINVMELENMGIYNED